VLGDGFTGGQAINYSMADIVVTGDITKKALTAASTVNPKVYDGTPAAGTVSVGPVTGLAGTETLVITALAGDYADAEAGTGKATTITYQIADGTNGGLASNYSMADFITSGEITPKPVIITPDPGQTKLEGEDDPEFTYTNSEWTNNANITGDLWREPGETEGTYAFLPGDLSAGPNYQLTLTASPASFTITGVVALNGFEDTGNLSFTNYPNPFQAFTTMSYTLPFNGRVTLSIHDINGQLVESVMNGELKTKGDYNLNVGQWINAPKSGILVAVLVLRSEGRELHQTIKLIRER
jgi:hypothetical protein